MNDVQKAVTGRTAAAIQPALDLYAERNRLLVVVYRLPLKDLKRLNELLSKLNELLSKLTDSDLADLAAYAEGLAAWGSPESESPDAQVPQGSPASSDSDPTGSGGV